MHAAAGRWKNKPKDQINLTDEDSRIMPVAGGGFEQCYNAQAVVATGVEPNFMGISSG
jgi:hypothetical protein